jgi:hypothetical protein
MTDLAASGPYPRGTVPVPALDFGRLTDGEKYHRAVPGYMRRIGMLYEALYERFGDEGLALIRDVSTEYGARIGENVQKRRPLRGVADVGRYLLKVFDMVTPDWRIEEFTQDRLVIGVERCPYGFAHDEVCQAHTCMEQALVAALDPKLEYSVDRSIPRGDQQCEHLLESRTP